MSAGMSWGQDRCRCGERDGRGVDQHPLARPPPGPVALHGRRALRHPVSHRPGVRVPLHHAGRQQGDALLARSHW